MNAPAYLPLLNRIRAEFPQPVADRTHDAHFGLSVLRALELCKRAQVDGAPPGPDGGA